MNDGRREQAIQLRQQGLSINAIATKLKAAKSSVSIWTREVRLSDTQRVYLKNQSHTPASVEKRRQARLNNEAVRRNLAIRDAYLSVGSITNRELWLIGTALYWAEGGKTQRTVRFSNGDPEMIKLMMRYFRESCAVPEEKFRGYIHIHDSLDHCAAEHYWSEVSSIPITNFYKTYRKPNPSSRGLRQTLPHGVFDIYVADVNLFLKIQGWIMALYSTHPNNKKRPTNGGR